MEELRSTEILDKEIEADARKKAEKILRKTEEESKKILESVSERLEAVKKEKSLFFDEKIKDFENDKLNSFPLEKQRFLVKFIQNAFSENINDFLNSLTEDERLSLVINKSKKNFPLIESKKVLAYIYGFDIKSCEKKLSEIFGSALLNVEKTEFKKILVEEPLNLSFKEGIILEADDKSVRIRMTLSEIFSQVEDENREQLFNALFEGRL